MSEKEYPIPDPETEPNKALVLSYKTLKGVNFDDRGWDRIHWARCSKSAQVLLDICESFIMAEKCLASLAKQFEDQELAWTFETITKHAHDWLLKNGRKTNANNARQRLFSEIARRRAEEKTTGVGEPTTARQILDGMRNMSSVRSNPGTRE